MVNPTIPIAPGCSIAGRYACRHGLITGATGTGKTYTLATLAEGFSAAGTPVFLVDAKGDLEGMLAGPCPAAPLTPGRDARVTIAALGPTLLARALDVTEAQAGAIDLAFALAEHEARPLATIADLRGLLQYMSEHARPLSRRYGLVSPASVAVLQRSLMALEREGGAAILNRGTFDVAQLLGEPNATHGTVTILRAARLLRTPSLYAAFLLFALQDLYDRLPEVGDLPRPRLAVFLDEAHLFFSDAAPGLVQRVERIVRLIRSKGVAVYFASQSPSDIPSTILSQLGNRVQHGMRAATMQDQRAARIAAETLPINPRVDAQAAILTMGVGEALVSTIGPQGAPTPVQRVRVQLPRSRLGAVTLDDEADVGAFRARRDDVRGRGLVRLAMVAASGLGAAAFGLMMLAH